MPEVKHSVFGSVGMSSSPKVETNTESYQNDLQSLIELGIIRDTVSISNKLFMMRSLTAREKLELAKFLGDSPTAERLFEFNIKILANSIETVDGILFEDFHTERQADPILRKQDLLSAMQSPVLAKLLDFYNKITERCDSQFELGEVKK